MNNRGFTLIEVALLLVVVGLVASFGIGIIKPIQDSKKTSVTMKNIRLVEQALQIYVEQFGCLPCPANGSLASNGADNDFGRSFAGGAVVATNCTGAACQIADAVVPWRTLGLAEEQAIDGWDNRLRYYTAGAPAPPASCGGAAGSQSTSGMIRCSTTSYPAGTLTLQDNDGVFGALPVLPVYVLISAGPDGALARQYKTGTLTGDHFTQTGLGGGQDENSDGDAVFSYGDFIAVDDVTHFDDIVQFMTAPVMIQKCGPGACGNPS